MCIYCIQSWMKLYQCIKVSQGNIVCIQQGHGNFLEWKNQWHQIPWRRMTCYWKPDMEKMSLLAFLIAVIKLFTLLICLPLFMWKIRMNPTQYEFLVKMVFTKIKKDTKLYCLYLNFRLYTKENFRFIF